MPASVKYFVTICVFLLTACNAEDFKRATYGSLEQLQHQQCYREMGSQCEKRESYQDYQDKRKELDNAQ